MRRIAILTVGLLAAFSAFGQAPAKGRGAAGASGASGAAATPGPKPKSKAEADAVVALGKATDADGQIAAAENLITNFPTSDFKGTALFVEAEAYHTKRDDTKALAMAEQSYDADPKNFETLLLLAEIYSNTTKATDLDMTDKLDKSDKYSKDALDLLATAPKPNAAMSDSDWAEARKGEQSRGWASLGFSAVLRKNFDDAKTDFQKSVDLSVNPVTMLYIDRAYLAAKRYDDAIAWTDKAVAAANGNAQIAQYANSDKTRATALKNAK
jgi:tetratricopeptide (TPR) repeat protein